MVAESQELAQDVFDRATRDAQVAPTIDRDKADVGFWHLGQRGPVRTERSLHVQEWAAIRGNYAGGSAARSTT